MSRRSREDEVIKYLITFQARHFRMPTRKEASHDLKIWLGVLNRILVKAEEAGRLKRIPHGVINYRILK